MIARRQLVQDMLRIGPHGGAHRVALRAAVSVAVPLLMLWSVDRLEWSIYASFGAFTSLYGRNRFGSARLRVQATLAILLTGAVAVGVWVGTSPDRSWLAVPVAGVVAGLGSWISEVEEWHPPGPLFLVFGFAAVASIPSTPGDIIFGALVTGASALFSLAIGSAGALWRSVRPAGPAFRTGWRVRSWSPSTRRHVGRNVLGVLLAGSVATAAGIGHPYWAMVSAVVPLAVRDLVPQLIRGVHRVVGTAMGLVLAGLLLSLDATALVVILVVILLQAVTELLVGRNYALALIAITPLALLMVHLTHTDSDPAGRPRRRDLDRGRDRSPGRVRHP